MAGLGSIQRMGVNEIVKWRMVKNPVKARQGIAQAMREFGQILVRAELEIGRVPFGQNPNLERKTRRVWTYRRPSFMLRHEPLAALGVVPDHLTEKTAAIGFVIFSRAVDLRAKLLRRLCHGHQLGVNMLQRR